MPRPADEPPQARFHGAPPPPPPPPLQPRPQGAKPNRSRCAPAAAEPKRRSATSAVANHDNDAADVRADPSRGIQRPTTVRRLRCASLVSECRCAISCAPVLLGVVSSLTSHSCSSAVISCHRRRRARRRPTLPCAISGASQWLGRAVQDDLRQLEEEVAARHS